MRRSTATLALAEPPVVIPELVDYTKDIFANVVAAPLTIPSHAVRLKGTKPPAGAPQTYIDRYNAAVSDWYVAPMWYTPEQAQYIMDHHNGRNRPVNQSWEKLNRKIEGGVWFMNAETVVFGSDGHLLNGQHRMKATAKGTVPVMLLVVFNVNPDVFCTLDQAAIRRPSDVLAMSGYDNCKVLSAALGWVKRHEHNQIRGSWLAVPNEEAVSYLAQHPNIIKSVEKVKTDWADIRLYPASVMAFLHYQLMRVDPKAATSFFKKVVEGVNVQEGTHENLLRRRLLKEMGKVNHIGQYIIMAAITFKTWINIRSGKEVGEAIGWKREGTGKNKGKGKKHGREEFPTWEEVQGIAPVVARRGD